MCLSDKRQGFVLLLLTATAALSGCGNDTFAPPPPSGTKAARPVGPIAPIQAKEIVFILPAGDNEDLRTIESVARLQTGQARAAFRSLKVSEEEPPAKQAEMIKQAVADGASAIVIVPNAAKETAEALAAVDQKKTPIIVLGQLPAGVKGGPYTLITWPAFGPSAKLIVDAIVEDVKKASLPEDAPVLFLKADPPDMTSAARDAALLDALKTTKHPVAATVPMSSDATAKAVLNAALKAHPKICAIIGDDVLGVSTATSVRVDMKDAGAYLIGGYCATNITIKLVDLNQNSILVDRNVEGLIRKAIASALQRTEGKSVPDRIEVEMTVRRAVGNVSKPVPLVP